MGSALDRLIAGQQSSSGTPPSALDALIAKQKGASQPDASNPSVMDDLKTLGHNMTSAPGWGRIGMGVYHGIVDPAATGLTELAGPGQLDAQAAYDKAHPNQSAFMPRVASDPVGRIAAPLSIAASALPIGRAVEGVVGDGIAAKIAGSAAHGAAVGAAGNPLHPLHGAAEGALAGGALDALIHAPAAASHVADVSGDMVPRDLGTDKGFQEQANAITPAGTDFKGQRIDVGPNANKLDVAADSPPVPGPARRPAYLLPKDQQPPIEPAADAATQTFGGTVGRRPAGAITSTTAAPEVLLNGEVKLPDQLPSAPTQANDNTSVNRLSTPVSYDALGKLDDVNPRLQPIVSSNGNFDVRPGVLNRVNKDFSDVLPASPPRITMPQRYTPGESVSAVGAEAPATPEPLASTPKNVSADELINKSKLDLDPNGEKAFQAETERAKASGLDKTKVSFETQRAAASDFAKSINMDPKTLDPNKMGRLSGAQIVGLKNVLSKNLNDMGEASKRMSDPDLSVEDAEKLNDHLDGLRKQNDALMSKIVSETSEKGRDLGFLRQMSNATLDPASWVVIAGKTANRLLTDDEKFTIMGLAKDAADACGSGL